MISVWPSRGVIVQHSKNFDIAIFLGTINMVNVKLCMIVPMVVWWWLFPLSQGFWENVHSFPAFTFFFFF